METKLKKTIDTYETTAQYYTDTHGSMDEVAQIAEHFLNHIIGDKILDIGCGPGRASRYFSEKGYITTGIDLTEKFLEITKKNSPKTTLYKMDMRHLSFPSESFDAIWACASFLHIAKKEANTTLLGFNKVLKKGGLMAISVKAGFGEGMIKKEHYLGHEKFFAFWKQDELEKEITNAGFDVIHTIIENKRDTWINVFAVKK